MTFRHHRQRARFFSFETGRAKCKANVPLKRAWTPLKEAILFHLPACHAAGRCDFAELARLAGVREEVAVEVVGELAAGGLVRFAGEAVDVTEEGEAALQAMRKRDTA